MNTPCVKHNKKFRTKNDLPRAKLSRLDFKFVC